MRWVSMTMTYVAKLYVPRVNKRFDYHINEEPYYKN